MKNDYPKLRAFLKGLGGTEAQEAFARKCDTSLNYIRKAMSKGSRMDVALVEKIVVHSDFAVPPEELREDIDWSVFAFDQGMKPFTRPGARSVGARRREAAAA